MSTGMFESCITGHWFNTKAKAIWSDTGTIQAWLDVEAALAQAQARLGMIPQAGADIISRSANVDLLDIEAIKNGIRETCHPFVPVLKEFERACGKEAAGYIHWGATTQNIFDTGAVLQLRSSHKLMSDFLAKTLAALRGLAATSKDYVQAGRTHGQHALPITFGFKVAGWYAELYRIEKRLNDATEDAFIVNMGGAVGTFSAMEGHGREVQEGIARLLELSSSPVPVRTSYDGVTHYVAVLGQLAAFAEKVAEELIFLQRTEIAELEESFHHGKVGSSTMAQKRNPQNAQNLVGLAQLMQSRIPLSYRSMVRMNEGDAAESNVMDVTLPEAAILSVSIAENLLNLISGLQVYPATMLENIRLTKGLILSESIMMALAKDIGRSEAHHLLYEAAMESVRHHSSFSDCIRNQLTKAKINVSIDIESLLDETRYIGEAVNCVEYVLQNLKH
ncbi:MAG: adenylosuccinate lyase family protein [Citrobacter sp.]|uniref:class-II fumarase/aspartase family protein n=1 Tax=Citrobacter TaxID=544 RepID=UPI002433582A|nr:MULTISPECIES: adenylosuccinate lyase family protein [Citrobacter]MDU2943272.1 adenylosuccinate lyase family protein [Citrobacter sp.]WFW20318.1 adenylosuccinate lyase family protein [Citrobacter braakii]